MRKTVYLMGVMIMGFGLKSAAQLHPAPLAAPLPLTKNIRVLPQNFYSQHLPFTCKKEDQLQKHTGLNLFIRLGSKDHVDYLERKPGTGAVRQWP